ncbi:response regulator [Marinibactrum halimedae]|uniref:Response regulator n=2 Tax=Marinibactrum halimedae TaxID=1444977 RepID=A0AA37TBM1_9GAMM|nr:response regulator [Marinibactrum halimedae]
MARKQIARSLPPNWPVTITFAGNGQEALEALQAGHGEVMFLDLTMPVMDGFETLENIRKLDLPTMVVVVSGDIQEKARARVLSLGALDFIKKPAEPDTVLEVLTRFGLYTPSSDETLTAAPQATKSVSDTQSETTQSDLSSRQSSSQFEVSSFDCYQEITNVAMGRAGDLLAKLTGEFVQLPVPKVNMLEPSELHMALNFAAEESISAVCQGFIGPGISGEALLLFEDTSINSMARLLHYSKITPDTEVEVLTDLSGALLGAILNGLGEQLNITFSQSYPNVLGRHSPVSQLIDANVKRWNTTLTIEVTYQIENFDIVCDVLLLFTADSVRSIDARLEYLLG